MTPEQFTAAYEALQEDKKIIEGEIEALKQRYIDSLPFKVGDCVRVKGSVYYHSTQKAWITKIKLVIGFKSLKFNLTVVKPKKDGTPSRRERELIICPENVELIKEEG